MSSSGRGRLLLARPRTHANTVGRASFLSELRSADDDGGGGGGGGGGLKGTGAAAGRGSAPLQPAQLVHPRGALLLDVEHVVANSCLEPRQWVQYLHANYPATFGAEEGAAVQAAGADGAGDGDAMLQGMAGAHNQLGSGGSQSNFEHLAQSRLSDMAEAASCLSDVDILHAADSATAVARRSTVEGASRGGYSGVSVHDVASLVACRGVILANRHPQAKRTFRSFSRPALASMVQVQAELSLSTRAQLTAYGGNDFLDLHRQGPGTGFGRGGGMGSGRQQGGGGGGSGGGGRAAVVQHCFLPVGGASSAPTDLLPFLLKLSGQVQLSFGFMQLLGRLNAFDTGGAFLRCGGDGGGGGLSRLPRAPGGGSFQRVTEANGGAADSGDNEDGDAQAALGLVGAGKLAKAASAARLSQAARGGGGGGGGGGLQQPALQQRPVAVCNDEEEDGMEELDDIEEF